MPLFIFGVKYTASRWLSEADATSFSKYCPKHSNIIPIKMDWNDIRKQFPVLEKYVYLNPAGGSPMSITAAEAGKRYFDEMVAEGDVPFESWLEQSDQVRFKIAELIHAAPKNIAFTLNTSSAMNHIAQIFRGKGEVLTMRDEFPSSTVPWINQGYTVRFVESIDHAYPIGWIEKHITPETKILVSSVVQYCTGFRQDMEALGDLCRRHNLIFVANATQAIGVMPIDVVKANIDCMAFSGLKWTTSGYGAGVVYLSDKILQNHKLPCAGWQSVVSPGLMDNETFHLKQEASVLEAGCPHFSSVFALGGAFDLINSIGVEKIHQRVLELNRQLQQKIIDTGLPVISFTDEKHRSGITIIKTRNAKTIKEKLLAKNIFIAARGEGIRVSVSFFNNEQDIETFIAAIIELKALF
jgi:cysteine desulfurase / selenocysteine lyase